VSSLCSGLLTIGPRFGGALDDSAKDFTNAFDSGSSPAQFVAAMRKADKLIMGIGHRIRSVENPDQRVCIVKEFAKKHFPTTPLLDYALEVEKITTAKRSNLILNVDGAIATAFVDLLRGCAPHLFLLSLPCADPPPLMLRQLRCVHFRGSRRSHCEWLSKWPVCPGA
jgi:ATP citrate (pro-S)-lyase